MTNRNPKGKGRVQVTIVKLNALFCCDLLLQLSIIQMYIKMTKEPTSIKPA